MQRRSDAAPPQAREVGASGETPLQITRGIIKPKHMPVIKRKDVVDLKKLGDFGEVVLVDEDSPTGWVLPPIEWNGKRYIVFDTETYPYYPSSREVPRDVIRRWVGTGKSAVPQDYPFVISVRYANGCKSFYSKDRKALRKCCQQIFTDDTIEYIAHNISFDLCMLHNIGIAVEGPLHDTLLIAKLVDENRPNFQLKSLVADYGIIDYENAVDRYKSTNRVTRYDQLPDRLLCSYANADVENCWRLFQREYPLLVDGLDEAYAVEQAVIESNFEMVRVGMRVDLDYEQPLKKMLQERADELERSIYDTAGKRFNINSAKQLYEVLVATGVDDSWVPKTEKGNPSLDKKAIERLANYYHVDLVKDIVEFRNCTKMLSTHAYGIYEQADAAGYVHCSINQAEATTGRYSITKPALQTIPRDDKRIKRMFIPSDEYVIVEIDMDSEEARVTAHYMQDQALIDSLNNGIDMHSYNTSKAMGIPYDECIERLAAGDKELKANRQRFKTVLFALLYGAGVSKIALTMNEHESVAQRVIGQLYQVLPKLRWLRSETEQAILRKHYIKMYKGRRRRLTGSESYKALNALIQGSCAMYLKVKQAAVHNYLRDYRSHLINVVHDSILLEVHKDELHIIPVIKSLMEDHESFRVALTASVEWSDVSWADKEAYNEPQA